MSAPGRPMRYPAAVEARVVALYRESDLRCAEIADACGVSHGYIALAVKRAGLPLRTTYNTRGKGKDQGAGPDPSTLLRRCPRCYGIAAGACCPNGHPFEAA